MSCPLRFPSWKSVAGIQPIWQACLYSKGPPSFQKASFKLSLKQCHLTGLYDATYFSVGKPAKLSNEAPLRSVVWMESWTHKPCPLGVLPAGAPPLVRVTLSFTCCSRPENLICSRVFLLAQSAICSVPIEQIPQSMIPSH